MKDLVNTLPKDNYNLLQYLFSLLQQISQNATISQMNAENLAIVIAPNLIWEKELNLNPSAVQNLVKGNTLTCLMIEHCDEIFGLLDNNNK